MLDDRGGGLGRLIGWPAEAEQRELRIRVIETAAGRRTLTTYKEPPADADSGSKPEHETAIEHGAPIDKLLRDLGLVELVRLTKTLRQLPVRVRRQGFPRHDGNRARTGRHVPGAREPALADVRGLLTELGLIEHLDPLDYTEAVMRARRR